MTDSALPNKTVMKQRRGRLATSFEFTDETLGYVFQAKSGTKIQRQIPWQNIPSAFHNQDVVERDRAIIWLAIFLTIISSVAVITHEDQSWQAMLFYMIFSTILMAIAFTSRRLRRNWKTRFTMITAENTNLIVFHDKLHDPIIGEIGRRREKALLRHAVINPQQSARQNLRRFQFLAREGLITPEVFMGFQRQLLPHVTESLLKPAFAYGNDVSFVQKHMGSSCSFDFHPDYFRYQRKTVVNGEKSHNIRYENLPNKPGSLDQIGIRNTGVFLAVAWTFMALFVLFSYMGHVHPDNYYVGPEGLKRAAVQLGPITLAFIAVLAVADKFGRTRYTQILPRLLVYIDAQHDAIIAELEKRRRAALKWYAEPDPLLKTEEQQTILSRLKETGIITEDELRTAAAKSAAMQAYFSMDAPVSTEPAVEARPTLH